jgi:histidyl-tRNA synthetase
MAKPTLPQGTRDFGPDIVRKRNYILDTIRSVFQLYGYQPLETPAMENIETLMGKYGEEGDKLIFRILDSGNPFSKDFLEEILKLFKKLQEYFKENHAMLQHYKDNYPQYSHLDNSLSNPIWNLNPEVLADLFMTFIDEDKVSYNNLLSTKQEISGKALKYDLTIPFARYVAMNHNTLTFPFKRYQIQPVWRADRPQKGRYREFYQCDADVVGSNSLLNEAELAVIYATVFAQLKIDAAIKINHRKILTGLAEKCGLPDKMTDITSAIDKIDKIGLEKVKIELINKGLSSEQVPIIETYLQIKGDNDEKLEQLRAFFGDNQTAKTGIAEIDTLLKLLSHNYEELVIEPGLARGLNYYTGTIFEVQPKGVSIGSIGGGGRYDDLTGLFGVPGIPGVGISFGVDRIYDVMEELSLFPADIYFGTQVLFFNLGNKESKKAFELAQQLRHKGVRCEVYHENAKFEKQFKYAEKKNIPYVVIIGEKELKENTCNIKNLATGQQETISMTDLADYKF